MHDLASFFRSIEFFPREGIFDDTRIEKVILNKKEEVFHVFLHAKNVLPISDLDALFKAKENKINGKYKCNILIDYDEIKESDCLSYVNEIVKRLTDKKPSLISLVECVPTIDDDIIIFEVMSPAEEENIKKEEASIRKLLAEYGLKDYFITSDNRVSIINGVEVLLYQYEEQYIVDFKYNDMYYEIEANHVTLEELLTLIRGIFQDHDELNVNEIDEVYSSEVDSDVRITNVVDSTVDVNIPWEFDDFGIPKVYFTSTSELFIHDLRYEYKNGEREFTVAFSSIEEPIRDYYFLRDGEESFIHGVCMSIYQHENIYYAEFKINNHYYDVETTNMNEEELLEILEVIINSETKNT